MGNGLTKIKLLFAARDLREYLARRLERLPRSQQQVMQFYFRDDLDLEEIARRLEGDPVQTRQLWLSALHRTCADEGEKKEK